MKNPETYEAMKDPETYVEPKTYAEPKHPDVIEGTPEEKAQIARNIAAARPRQLLYLKITAYCPIEMDAAAAFLSAADAFEAACQTAKVELTKYDVSVTPPSEATEKRDADRAKRQVEKREAEKREAEKLEAEQRTAKTMVTGARP